MLGQQKAPCGGSGAAIREEQSLCQPQRRTGLPRGSVGWRGGCLISVLPVLVLQDAETRTPQLPASSTRCCAVGLRLGKAAEQGEWLQFTAKVNRF